VQAQALQALGRLEQAQQQAQAALALCSGPEQTKGRVELIEILATIEYHRSQPQRALELARQARELFRDSADRRGLARTQMRVGSLLIVIGDADAGAAELQVARRMAAELHLVETERVAIINLLKVHADRGEGQAMLALTEEAWNLSPSFASPRNRQILLQAKGFAHGLLGQLGRCLTLAEQFLAESAASGEPAARQYAVLTVLDLLVYLGDFERGRALLRELRGQGTEVAYFGIKLALNRAFLEYKAGDIAAARAALAEIGDALSLQQEQDRVMLALRQAEVLLAEGDAAASLAMLEPWRAGVPNIDLQALIWALRLQAQRARGGVNAADWAEAHALLEEGRLPPTEALDLRRELWRTAPSPALAKALKRSIDAEVARLAASLAEHPRARSAFLALHAN
jgi:hypothetical protein